MFKRILKGRFGFQLNEIMEGTHHLVDKPEVELPFRFCVDWGSRSVREFLNPFGDRFLVAELKGNITAGGLCENTTCVGDLALRYFKDASIAYDFSFWLDGEKYTYSGKKIGIRPWNLHRTHTTCYGHIRNANGDVVSSSTTYFKLRTLPAFLASLRIV